MFDIEWTAHSYTDACAYDAALAAVETHCQKLGLDPAALYAAQIDEDATDHDHDAWIALERVFAGVAFDGWSTQPDNYTLVWR